MQNRTKLNSHICVIGVTISILQTVWNNHIYEVLEIKKITSNNLTPQVLSKSKKNIFRRAIVYKMVKKLRYLFQQKYNFKIYSLIKYRNSEV
jgi:hypothetical protein